MAYNKYIIRNPKNGNQTEINEIMLISIIEMVKRRNKKLHDILVTKYETLENERYNYEE